MVLCEAGLGWAGWCGLGFNENICWAGLVGVGSASMKIYLKNIIPSPDLSTRLLPKVGHQVLPNTKPYYSLTHKLFPTNNILFISPT